MRPMAVSTARRDRSTRLAKACIRLPLVCYGERGPSGRIPSSHRVQRLGRAPLPLRSDPLPVGALLHQHFLGVKRNGVCAIGGDFFESVPGGGDAYILKSIIHAYDDERAARILTNCQHRMEEKGALLLVERVLPARTSQSSATQAVTLNDLNMLVTSGGHERTEAEFRALFSAAGFRLTNIIVTQAPMGFSVIEGVRV